MPRPDRHSRDLRQVEDAHPLAVAHRRFGELHAALPGVSRTVLTEQLGQLVDDGVVGRTVAQAGGVVTVSYAFSERGRALIPALDCLGAWGAEADT